MTLIATSNHRSAYAFLLARLGLGNLLGALRVDGLELLLLRNDVLLGRGQHRRGVLVLVFQEPVRQIHAIVVVRVPTVRRRSDNSSFAKHTD